MSRAAAIRAWLATQDGPRSPDAIADALGYPKGCLTRDGKQTDRMRLHWTIGEMFRKGLLVRTGSGRRFVYALGRPVAEPLTDAEKRDRRNARMRKRYVERRACMTAEEYNAQRAQDALRKREERARQRAARDAAVKRARAQEALQRAKTIVQRMKSTQETKAKAAPKVRPQPAPTVAPTPILQAPRVERFETVEEWMARTGQRPEVLPAAWNQERVA
jgi:hypothetical protein